MQKYTLELKDYNKLKETFNKGDLQITYDSNGYLTRIRYNDTTVIGPTTIGYDSNFGIWCGNYIRENITEYSKYGCRDFYHINVTCSEFIDFICKVHDKCGLYDNEPIHDIDNWENFYSNYVQHNRTKVEDNIMENDYHEFFDITNINWQYEETDDLTVGDFDLSKINGKYGDSVLKFVLDHYELVNVQNGTVSGLDYCDYDNYKRELCNEIVDMAMTGFDTEGNKLDMGMLAELRMYLIWVVDCIEKEKK